MKINVHIERLILHGLPLEQRQGSHVQETVERELTRLLTEPPSTQPFTTSRSLASVEAGSIHVAEPADPGRLGKHISAAVHSRLGGQR